MDRVPQEIFKEIIKQSRNVYEIRRHFPHHHTEEILLPPFNASRVCRTWRNTLVNDPTIWTCIRIREMHPDAVKEALRRSKSAPLHVFVRWTAWDRPQDLKKEPLDVTFREMHRFATLQIMVVHDPKQDMLRQIVINLLQSAPILQEFHFIVLDDWNEDERIIPTLFLGNAPNLKYITLQVRGDLERFLHIPKFKNLASLCLDLARHAVVHCDRLMDFLELLPNLQTFSITMQDENYQPNIVPAISDDRRVHLPCLQRLSLGREIGPIDLIFLVLKHIDCPFETLKFNILVRDNIQYNDPAPLLQFLQQHHLPYLWLDLYSKSMALLDTYPHDKATKIFEAHFRASRALGFVRMFNVLDITYLHFSSPPSEVDNIPEILRTFINVEVLKTYDVDLDDRCDMRMSNLVLMALMPQPRSSRGAGVSTQGCLDSDSAPQFLCPSLKTFRLKWNATSIRMDLGYAGMLLACLKARRHGGIPFKVIICPEFDWLSPNFGKGVESRLREDSSIEIIKGKPLPDVFKPCNLIDEPWFKDWAQTQPDNIQVQDHSESESIETE